MRGPCSIVPGPGATNMRPKPRLFAEAGSLDDPVDGEMSGPAKKNLPAGMIPLDRDARQGAKLASEQ